MLPLRYYGNIAYYAAMAAHGKAVICADALYDKREKAVHRCDITDTHGPVSLTVPLAKPHGIARARWCDVALSEHGAWWHVHRVTLESAYGRTPFFEFYFDRFLTLLQKDVVNTHHTIADLDLAIDSIIRDILLIETEVSVSTTTLTAVADYTDAAMMAVKSPKVDFNSEFTPYYQVRAERQGFIPNLSALDLIFNLGPEAPIYLKKLIDRYIPKQ